MFEYLESIVDYYVQEMGDDPLAALIKSAPCAVPEPNIRLVVDGEVILAHGNIDTFIIDRVVHYLLEPNLTALGEYEEESRTLVTDDGKVYHLYNYGVVTRMPAAAATVLSIR